MTAVDTVLPTIGDVAAGVAAVAAAIGLRYARQTVREARAERWAGEHARLVRRLEWVGETIEQIDRLAEDDQHIQPPGESWRRGRNLLAQGFVGLAGLLPQTGKLVDCADPYSARSMAVLAREEVAGELARLARRHGPPAHVSARAGARRRGPLSFLTCRNARRSSRSPGTPCRSATQTRSTFRGPGTPSSTWSAIT